MVAHLGKHIVFASACFLLLSLAGATVQAQHAVELRCRGGEDAFVIDKLTANTLSLNFNSSARPAGANSKGLEPGTCSWIDRTVNEEEWRQIQFVVTAGEAVSIPVRLRSSKVLWSFFVVNTDRGYFEAKRHHLWTAGTKPSGGKVVNPTPQ